MRVQAVSERASAMRAAQLSYTNAPIHVEIVQAADLQKAAAAPTGDVTSCMQGSNGKGASHRENAVHGISQNPDITFSSTSCCLFLHARAALQDNDEACCLCRRTALKESPARGS